VNTVTVNGVEYKFGQNEHVVVIGSSIIIGDTRFEGKQEDTLVVELKGDPVSVYASSNVVVHGDVSKTVNAQGGVSIHGNTGGVNTQGDVVVTGNVLGDIDTQGDVMVAGNHQGKIDTMGDVTVGRSIKAQ
jgi:hypothetical protein